MDGRTFELITTGFSVASKLLSFMSGYSGVAGFPDPERISDDLNSAPPLALRPPGGAIMEAGRQGRHLPSSQGAHRVNKANREVSKSLATVGSLVALVLALSACGQVTTKKFTQAPIPGEPDAQGAVGVARASI